MWRHSPKTIRSFCLIQDVFVTQLSAESHRDVIRPLIKITKKTFGVVKQQGASLGGCVLARVGGGVDERQTG